ncbi:MAG: Elongation factor P [Alphaproteobacteria bacterium MarineAlpha9_Bin4]|nr:elongation factor P [Pelagibacterales bacterium]PPR25761.1 MAG: Elongation factor P [Alphaproteobacteria bacterium MarineAlpha9_Bin4]|tara:strand:- start:239 stop:805 length:567 start_codon:yes stop_codon:yes gene_type:complete
MKINGNSLKPGMIISHKGSNWKVVSAQSVKPGKGGAFAQVELKNLKDNSKLNERFRASEDVDRLYVESKEFQFSYKDDKDFYFMDTANYEQINLNIDIVGELESFLQDNMLVSIEFVDDKPVSLKLPEHIKEKVVETEAVIKGQTVSSSFKPAILSNGFKVMVPGHIENNTFIIISTTTFTYVEKAKS